MSFGTGIVLFALIICVFITIWVYMAYCSTNEIRMFTNPKYEERIKKLEKQMEELKKE